MTLKTLFKKLDKVYHNEGILDNTEACQEDGDGLAKFIVHEIKSVMGHKTANLNAYDLGELSNAMDRALSELGDVACELHALHAKQFEREHKK